MEFTFKNKDNDYLKLRREHIGDIQPKFWYFDREKHMKCLVKRQFAMKVVDGEPKSRMFNHYGEYFGYLLGEKAEIDVCPVELITIHDTRNEYSKTKRFYTACASYNLKNPEEELFSGETIINKFKMNNPEIFYKILQKNSLENLKKGSITTNLAEDNIEIILATIAWETKKFEEARDIRTKEEIKEDIARNLTKTIEMVAYDCLFGNSDRHSVNWSMKYNVQAGTVEMYSNYDNEAVLGLRKTEYEIKKAVESEEATKQFSQNELHSRMGISPINSGVTYKNMLEYLISKYPSLTIPAIIKITNNVPVEFVASLYDASFCITSRSEDASELQETDELPEEFKTFGVRLYSERRDYAIELVKKFQEKQKIRNTNQVLDFVI